MKRTDMVTYLAKLLKTYDNGEVDADEVLAGLENMGMRAPRLDEDRVQALYHIYVDCPINMWDEEFEADKKAVEAYNKRMQWRRESE